MRLLQGYHNMFRDIHIFSVTTTTTAEALHFSIQELVIVECSGQVQIKILRCFFLCVVYFHAKIKLYVFFVVQCV